MRIAPGGLIYEPSRWVRRGDLMKLEELLKGTGAVCPAALAKTEITRLCSDSREEMGEGSLFVCLKGKKFDAHEAVPELAKRGVSVFVTERDCGIENQVIVSDTRAALSLIWSSFTSNPDKKMKMIGVTGTNGKTTVTTLVKQLLEKFGHKSGLIGTCGDEIGDTFYHSERLQPSTPEPKDLYPLLKKMADEGCEYCVMEATSQGLEQERLAGIEFEVGAFTNLTQDHLDVHGTMENYYQAKKKLFSQCRMALVNIDDPYGKRLFDEIPDLPGHPKVSSYGMHNEYAYYIPFLGHSTASGSTFTFKTGGLLFGKDCGTAKINLPGDYNIMNALCVMGIMHMLGFPAEEIVSHMVELKGVKGRCEVVPTGENFTVIIDYAHSPDAIENILKSVRSCMRGGRLVCLFGCGGDRDAKKRPLMAEAAEENADFLVITSDNPRTEDPALIIKDILKGLKGTKPYVSIVNREDAINWAIVNAQEDDTIVLAGKGHEDYQIIGTVKRHFDEREKVASALKMRK